VNVTEKPIINFFKILQDAYNFLKDGIFSHQIFHLDEVGFLSRICVGEILTKQTTKSPNLIDHGDGNQISMRDGILMKSNTMGDFFTKKSLPSQKSHQLLFKF